MVATGLFPITLPNTIVSQHSARYRVKVPGRTRDVLFVLSLSVANDVLKLPTS